jgi:hypothetical protein
VTPQQLQAIIVGALQQALGSGQTSPESAMLILESSKLEVFWTKKKNDESRIQKVQIIPPNSMNGGGR